MSSSIQPTKSGTFELRWRENGHQKSKTLKTRKEAERRQQEIEQRLVEGKPIIRRQDAPTLREFGNRWLASKQGLEPTTKAKYAEWLAVHIYPALGHLSVTSHDLRPKRLSEWQHQRLDEGAGPAVLGKAQTLLRQILKQAVNIEYLDSNPVDSVDRPEYRKKPHRWLTVDEVEKLRSWYLKRDDLGSATLISILAYVGIRPQDALALTWTDIHDGRLSVTRKVSDGKIVPGSKTGEGHKRRVKVPAPVLADLEEWRATDDLIFPRASDGQPWSKTDWDNWRSRGWVKQKRSDKMVRPKCFKAAAEACELGETLKPYDLRHTAASLMAAAGWTAHEIADQLGHSPIQSMRDYQHLLDLDGPRLSLDAYILEARGQLPSVRDPLRNGSR